MNELFSNYPKIQNDLEIVKKTMIKYSKVPQKDFESTLVDIFSTKSKLLRPALVLISAGFGNESINKDVYDLAAATEMLHVATLIHDDIIDDADLRRGAQSIQKQYGKGFAVLTGDYLFAKSFSIIFETKVIESIKEAGRTVTKLSLGEALQHFARFNVNPSFKTYMRIVSGKTAALFSMSCFLGANATNCSQETANKLYRIGDYIGKSFQIKDDILDFTSNNLTFGKPVFNDIQKGIYTLPMIFALQESKRLKEILKTPSVEEYVDEITTIVKETNSLSRASDVANSYLNKAIQITNTLPDGESKEMLLYLIQVIDSRTF